jgi:RNA polymerase sigma-70 factor (ECF subfamily)
MTQSEWLAEQFQADRPRLTAVASRMLGSSVDAEDAVQEAWLRLSRSDTAGVENLRAWLTTVVGRICLDMLRARRLRQDTPVEPAVPPGGAGDPEEEVELADSVGLALLVVLETLAPAERVAFVLHDLFDVPFEEIAVVVDRSPAAARQLASRARRRVRGSPGVPETDLARQRQVVEAFLAAARHGEFDALLAVLSPDVVLRSDAAAVAGGAPAELHGAEPVAGTFSGRARGARAAVVNGTIGAIVWGRGRRAAVALDITVVAGRIVTIDIVTDPETLAEMDLSPIGT